MKFFFALLAIFTASNLFAVRKDLSVNEISLYQKKMKQKSELSAEFEQKTFLALREKEVLAQGKAYFSAPSYVRWEKNSPNEIFLFSPKGFYHLDVDQKKGIEYEKHKGKGRELEEVMSAVLDFNSLMERYKLDGAYEEADRVSFKLRPKAASDIDFIEVGFHAKNMVVENVSLHFLQGNRSQFLFKNQKSAKIPKDTFTLPAGYTISKGF